jgi:hypothetical protein
MVKNKLLKKPLFYPLWSGKEILQLLKGALKNEKSNCGYPFTGNYCLYIHGMREKESHDAVILDARGHCYCECRAHAGSVDADTDAAGTGAGACGQLRRRHEPEPVKGLMDLIRRQFPSKFRELGGIAAEGRTLYDVVCNRLDSTASGHIQPDMARNKCLRGQVAGDA